MVPSVLMFIVLYLLSFFFVMNSDDWFIIWMGLEINMMSFILLVYNKKSIKNIESCLKYFFVQSLGSVMLLMLFYLNEEIMKLMGSLIMGYKMGAGFFFFWFPSVCEGLGWWSCFFLMTFQKVMPLVIMLCFISWVVWVMIFFSLIVGTWGALNEGRMKKLMAFSSIHHLGFLMVCVLMYKSIWLYYLMMYGIMIIPVVVMFGFLNIGNLIMINNWSKKMWFFLLMLSMGGMPPMLGFFLKWMVFFYMDNVGISMYVFMILMSVLMFYIYIRIVYDLMLGMSAILCWECKSKFNKYFLSLDLYSLYGMMLGIIMVMLMLL